MVAFRSAVVMEELCIHTFLVNCRAVCLQANLARVAKRKHRFVNFFEFFDRDCFNCKLAIVVNVTSHQPVPAHKLAIHPIATPTLTPTSDPTGCASYALYSPPTHVSHLKMSSQSHESDVVGRHSRNTLTSTSDVASPSTSTTVAAATAAATTSWYESRGMYWV